MKMRMRMRMKARVKIWKKVRHPMEDSVWRRLNSISRHLQINYEANQVLHSNFLSASDGLMKHVVSEAVIIGAMVLDIAATPTTSALPRTTTPGKVHYLAGGVARNVAECMSKLGSKPFMISTIGVDVGGNLLLGYWKSAGLALEGIQMRQDIGTPVVCNIYDMNGELATAVASVEAIEKFLTQEWIQQFRCNISSAPILMIDANLNPCSLKASCQLAAESGIPVWFEPVSVAKSKRIVSLVKFITFASPNEDELIAMANALSHEDRFLPIKVVANSGSKRSIECLFQMLKPAIIVLLENGVKVLVLTLGSDGVLLCSKDGLYFKDLLKKTKPSSYGKQLYEILSLSCPSKKFVSAAKSDRGGSHLYVVHFPALPASVLRLTGAGDCFVGGALTSICAGLDVMQSMAVGIAAAKAAVEVETNVPSEFSLARIADDASLIYSSAKVLCD